MEVIFAPWRMEVIEGYKSGTGCILCTIERSQKDAEQLVIHRGETCYLVMNKYPYTHGHLMVIPKRHVGNWEDLTEKELLEIQTITQKTIRVLKASFNSLGFNLGANLGRVAGAGIAEHVHFHIVPRWGGDFNFMPILAEVKVISEHLTETYKKLKAAWVANA